MVKKITISSELACADILYDKWPGRVNLSTPSAIVGGRHGKPLAILNLMPNKTQTEYLWLDLLLSCGFFGSVQFVTTYSYISKKIPIEYLTNNYVDFNSLKNKPPLAWIVTGAPLGVRLRIFEDAFFWKELIYIFDCAKQNKTPILGVCWGGNALFYHRYGIALDRMEKKAIGLFAHRSSKFSDEFGVTPNQKIDIPVARQSGFGSIDSLMKKGLLFDLINVNLGPCVVKSQKNMEWAVGNHLEYDLKTLLSEYRRDLGNQMQLTAQMEKCFSELNEKQFAKTPWRPLAIDVYTKWIKTITNI